MQINQLVRQPWQSHAPFPVSSSKGQKQKGGDRRKRTCVPMPKSNTPITKTFLPKCPLPKLKPEKKKSPKECCSLNQTRSAAILPCKKSAFVCIEQITENSNSAPRGYVDWSFQKRWMHCYNMLLPKRLSSAHLDGEYGMQSVWISATLRKLGSVVVQDWADDEREHTFLARIQGNPWPLW